MLAMVGGAVVALAIGEVAVRVLRIGPQFMEVEADAYRLSPNPRLRYEFIPGARFGDTRINADGMRDRPRAADKPGGAFRIACIGDSICAGFDTDRDETFPARLERLLNNHYAAPGRTFEVLNFGVTGYNITQITETLQARGPKYRPDLIVYAYCLNDIEGYSFELERLRSGVASAEQEYFDSLQGAGARLARWSRLYALWRYSRHRDTVAGNVRPVVRPHQEFLALGDATYGQYYREQYASLAGWQHVTDGLDHLAELAGQLEAPGYLVVFPVLRDLETYPLIDVHAKIANAGQERLFRTVDLLDTYRRFVRRTGREPKIDDLHPDSTGHAVAAVAILDALLAGGDVPVSAESLAPVAASDEPEAWIAELLAH